jgi:hypothetical protein
MNLVGLLSGGIQGEVGGTELTADRVGRATAGKLRVGDQPGSSVAWHLKLGHDTNTKSAGIAYDFRGVLLSVKQAIRTHGGKPWEEFALYAETLVFGEVPVKNVELHGCHAIESALEHVHRFEVASTVDHQTPPKEAGRIVDGDSRQHVLAA